MKRNVRRARIRGILALGALVSLLLLYVIGPRFSEPAKIRSAAATTLASKQGLDVRVTSLKARSADMAAANAEMDFYNRRLPATTAAIELEAAINAAADSVGLGRSRVSLVRPGAPTPVLVNPTIAYDAAQKPSASPTPTPTATPTESAAATPPTDAAVDPTKADLWEMPVTIQFSASNYGVIVKFVNALYSMSRLMVVDQVVVTPAGNGYNVTAVGRVFILKAGATGQ